MTQFMQFRDMLFKAFIAFEWPCEVKKVNIGGSKGLIYQFDFQLVQSGWYRIYIRQNSDKDGIEVSNNGTVFHLVSSKQQLAEQIPQEVWRLTGEEV